MQLLEALKKIDGARVQHYLATLSFKSVSKLVIWIVLFMCAVYVELGVIFFLCSLLYLIWINLGERNPDDDGPSAYSVFNKGVRKIDGTFEGGAAIESMLFQGNSQSKKGREDVIGVQFKSEPKQRTVQPPPRKMNRNDICYCGSGKKFKKCCAPLLEAQNNPNQSKRLFEQYDDLSDDD